MSFSIIEICDVRPFSTFKKNTSKIEAYFERERQASHKRSFHFADNGSSFSHGELFPLLYEINRAGFC